MAMAPDQSKSWTARDYILAALGGCLAATAIVIIVSVILSPGRIIFSVTHASRSNSTDKSGVDLKLTVSANSISHRAKVTYTSFFVVLSNSTSPTGRFTADAHIDTNFPKEYLSAPSVLSINASLHMPEGDLVTSFAGHGRLDYPGFTVVLTTEVRFKIGVARTKMYDIKVSCPGVEFPEEGSKPPPSRWNKCHD